MWLILMLLSWLTGAVMSTNPVPHLHSHGMWTRVHRITAAILGWLLLFSTLLRECPRSDHDGIRMHTTRSVRIQLLFLIQFTSESRWISMWSSRSIYRIGTSLEPVYKGTEHIFGSDVSPGWSTDCHVHTPIWTRVGLEICTSSSTSRRLRSTRVLSEKSNVPWFGRCMNGAPNGRSAGSRYTIL